MTKENKKSKKNKIEKRVSKFKRIYEYMFIGFSIFCILDIIAIYGYRAVYYYRKENYVKEDAKLVDTIFNQMNVVYTGDGLYRDNDDYYYSGINVNNYLYYDGRMWRIIGYDDKGIKIITDDNISSMVWGDNSNYKESYIYKWLNEDVFLGSINLRDKIVDGKWCNDIVDINNYKCDNEIISKVGLLSTQEYLRAGGVNSYLNNKSYFWTINVDKDNKPYYIHNNGGINNDIGHNNSLYNYGVRPVIYISSDIIYNGGDGSINNPYIISNNEEIEIGKHDIGSYVIYNEYKFRIMETSEDYVKLILDGYIVNEDNEKIKVRYDDIDDYLDKFIDNFNEEDLVKSKYIVTNYNYSNGYNYSDIIDDMDSYIGIPNVGDMNVCEYSDYWLNTYYNEDQGLVYKTVNNDSIMADLVDSENYIRPVISIKTNLIISGGAGTKESPYMIGDSK